MDGETQLLYLDNPTDESRCYSLDDIGFKASDFDSPVSEEATFVIVISTP